MCVCVCVCERERERERERLVGTSGYDDDGVGVMGREEDVEEKGKE